jgi:hypothetical protein
MVISQDENDKKKQKDDEERAAIKRKEVQSIQKMQIRGIVSPDSKELSDVESSLNSVVKKKGAVVGSHMSVEELRMNKAILKQISKKKKNGMGSLDNQSQVTNPMFSPNK